MAEINKLIKELSLAEIASQSEATIWANTYLLQHFLFDDIQEIYSALDKEKARKIITSAATLATPKFLSLVLQTKVEYYQTLIDKTDVQEDKDKLEDQLISLQLYTNILVTTINSHIEYSTTIKNTDIYTAIAQSVSTFKPKYPDKWPPITDEEKRKITDVDKKISQRPEGFRSDALLEVDASVCRHAHTISNEVCESRNLEPYACQIKMKRQNETTGHLVSVVFDNGDKSKPIFVDGQNAFSSQGFEEYKAVWRKYGWEITSAEASRLISNQDGNSSWDSVRFS